MPSVGKASTIIVILLVEESKLYVVVQLMVVKSPAGLFSINWVAVVDEMCV